MNTVEEIRVKTADVKITLEHHLKMGKKIISIAPAKMIRGEVREYLIHFGW